MSDNIRGALIMIISMAAYAFNDALTRSIPEDISVYQVMFLRGLMVTAALFCFVWYKGELRLSLPAGDRKLMVVRTIGEIAVTVFFLTALFNAPLSDVTAILQAAPLLLTLFGAWFFKERLGWRRLSASLAGLLGVLLIIQPGSNAFNLYLLFALAALAMIILRDLPTRYLSAGVSTNLTALIASLSITVTGGVFMLGIEWVPVSWIMIAHLVGAAVFIFVAYITSIAVMRVGELAFVQPFRYTAILFAFVIGYFVFDERPNLLAVIGVLIVVGAGVFTFYRESLQTK